MHRDIVKLSVNDMERNFDFYDFHSEIIERIITSNYAINNY